MAIRDSRGFLRGRIGEYVFRVVNGKQVVQPYQKNVAQTEKMQKSAQLFVRCSKQAAVIRGAYAPLTHGLRI